MLPRTCSISPSILFLGFCTSMLFYPLEHRASLYRTCCKRKTKSMHSFSHNKQIFRKTLSILQKKYNFLKTTCFDKNFSSEKAEQNFCCVVHNVTEITSMHTIISHCSKDNMITNIVSRSRYPKIQCLASILCSIRHTSQSQFASSFVKYRSLFKRGRDWLVLWIIRAEAIITVNQKLVVWRWGYVRGILSANST